MNRRQITSKQAGARVKVVDMNMPENEGRETIAETQRPSPKQSGQVDADRFFEFIPRTKI
jgi:hypothetical protein